MYDLLVLFLSSFFVVFLLGFQSMNVNSGYKVLAVVTSFGMSICNFALYKMMPNKDLSVMEIIFYAVGGPLGILVSMEVHNLISKKTSFWFDLYEWVGFGSKTSLSMSCLFLPKSSQKVSNS